MDVARRNQCQFCRFQKCLQTKMRREGKSMLLLPVLKWPSAIDTSFFLSLFFFLSFFLLFLSLCLPLSFSFFFFFLSPCFSLFLFPSLSLSLSLAISRSARKSHWHFHVPTTAAYQACLRPVSRSRGFNHSHGSNESGHVFNPTTIACHSNTIDSMG